jgi:acyl-[acyl-carrier-protein]-phospholipid O-acyltransferase / long-chain-fatty-acid--[acyl-carrier-protein] ligase
MPPGVHLIGLDDATFGPFESGSAVARRAGRQSRMKTETGYGSLLEDGGFEAFLWTQLLGAFNAIVFRTIVAAYTVHAALGKRAGAMFAIAFLFFAGYAGQIADRFSKSHVLQAAKAFEVAIMVIAIAALLSGRMELLLAVVFLLGAQISLFSPAEFGMLPEMAGEDRIVRANGLLGLTPFAAIVLGTGFGFFLYAHWKNEPLRMGLTLLGIAIAGSAASLRIRKVPASGLAEPFHWNPLHEIVEGARRLRSEKSLALAVLGISWFWFACALFLLAGSGFQVTALTAGIGLGSVAAGALSGDYIELGLVPMGAAFMGICSIGFGMTANGTLAISCLAGAGFGAGLFAVPLNAFLQREAGAAEKGRILATNNFANMAGIIAASGVIWILHDRLQWGAGGIILAFGAVTLPCSLYVVSRMPESVVRFTLWCMANLLFRIRLEGGENIPRTSGALLVSNHISYADAVLVGCLTRRRTIHFLMWQPIFDVPVANYFFRTLRTIPIDAASPKSTVRALRAARTELGSGELVGIFPEGEISRTGEIRAFERGFEKILHGSKAPVIPIHIDGLYGHPFSCKGGAPFQSWQKLWRPRVTVHVGTPIQGSISPFALREAVVRAHVFD